MINQRYKMKSNLEKVSELNLGIPDFSFSVDSSEEIAEEKLDEIFRPNFSVYTAKIIAKSAI